MARDGRPQPFPFPIPDPPRVQRQATPFPPPPLPSPEETVKLLARRIGGMPLPLFFVVGAVVGIVLAVTVVSLVRRSAPKKATQAKVVSVQAAAVVEHAHALFVWPPATAGERAAPSAPTAEAAPAAPLFIISPPAARPAPAAPETARASVAMNRPRATPRTSSAAPKREPALPSNLLAAGL